MQEAKNTLPKLPNKFARVIIYGCFVFIINLWCIVNPNKNENIPAGLRSLSEKAFITYVELYIGGAYN